MGSQAPTNTNITAPVSMAQGTSQKEGQKNCKSQNNNNNKMLAVNQSLLEMAEKTRWKL